MVDKNIILQDPVSGENVYPITITDNIYLPNGTPLMKYLNALPFPLGTLIHSTSILKNAGLHMADGGELMIGGVYDDFCQYVIANPSEFPILYDDEDLTVEGAKTALEKWQETFATYGQCGNYVITDTYIKLPAITKLSGGLVNTEMSKIASMNEAGLPNITGSITIGGAENGLCSQTGVFTRTGVADKYGTGHAQGAGPKFDCDASRSSSIYGKSSTVETEYVKFPYYIVVATVTKTDIEVNIDNIATELNNKIGKGECVRYPVSKWVSSDGLSWYTVYNDGWKECGGKVIVTSGSRTYKTVTLPVTFSTINYTVTTTYNEGTSGSGTGTTGYYSYIAQQKETGFRISVYGASAGQSSSYYCCGY